MSSGKFLVRQHKDVNRTNPVILNIEIDGSALTTTTVNAGVVGGVEAVQAKDASNVVTITFRTPFRNAKYMAHFTPVNNADCVAVSVTRAAGTLAYTTVKGSDFSTAVNDADMMITIIANDDDTII